MKIGLRNIRTLTGWPAQFEAARQIGADYLQVDGVPDEDVEEVAGLIEETGVRLWSITALSTAMLGPDMEASRREQASVRRTIDRAAELGAPCVTVFAGGDPARAPEENLDAFRGVFGPLAEHAEEAGVTLVFENCPMIGGRPPTPRNMAYCPAHWEAMFEAVPSPALGLELDVGHLPGLGIDPVRAVRDFGDRIRHTGMKDAAVDEEAVYRHGWRDPRISEHRVPGEGCIDFPAVIRALIQVGYEGPLTLDHVHPPTDTVERFQKAADYLRAAI